MEGSQEEALQQLEDVLEEAISNLWQTAVVVDDFTADQQPRFKDQMRAFTNSLAQMEALGRQITIRVPQRVIQRVDDGANPESVTDEYLELCKRKNDHARGRVFSTKLFQDMFQERLTQWDASRDEPPSL